MKIIIVNTHADGGGAARAAHRLHDGLTYIGHDSTMYVEHGQQESNVVVFEPSFSFADKLARGIRSRLIARDISGYSKTRSKGLEIFTDDRSRHGGQPIKNIPHGDVINFHWVAGFVNYASIPLLNQIPKVWTLHDMNPFTGGCHYDSGCDKYLTECGSCHQLGSANQKDLSNAIWKRKMAAFSSLASDRLHIVSPSKWLAQEAGRSSLLSKFSISVIPNGLDTQVFAPRRTEDLRMSLGIDADAKIVLFLADSVSNKRKGFQYLIDAIGTLDDSSKVVLISVGSGKNILPTKFRYVHISRVEDERILSMIYSLADVFVIPSVQDNLPNTVLEAMACGTPVVGFNIGGISDMVKHGENGFLVSAGDVISMKNAIRTILEDKELRLSMSQQCREHAVNEYDLTVQATRYSELFGSMIQNN